MKLSIPLIDRDPETVTAIKVGPLCVHPTTEGLPGYRVTHIETKRAFPAIFCSKEHALNVARKTRGLNWEKPLRKTVSTIKPARRCMMEQLKSCEDCRMNVKPMRVGKTA